MILFRRRPLVAVLAIVLVSPPAARAQQRYGGIVERILDAWKTADVVCLGEPRFSVTR